MQQEKEISSGGEKMLRVCSVRKIDAMGRIVLPKEVLKALEWEKNENLDISLNQAQNAIIISRRKMLCDFCGGASWLFYYNNHVLCRHCLKNIIELYHNIV